MKLVDALEIMQRPAASDESPFTVWLACGFEPLHLRTFLAAELTERLPLARVDVASGTFDDLLGNIQRAARSSVDAIAAVIEWSDVDPRLGLRRLGGWRVSDLGDIAEAAELQLERLERELSDASAAKPIALCLPTLALPPLFPERPGQSGAPQLQLAASLTRFAERLAHGGGVVVCNGQRLDERSAPARRRDVRAELNAGFPYSVTHASAVAAQLAELIAAETPKKGLITDLDDTLWAGILGEVGAANVSWSLDGGNQRHGLYQQLLASLASAGVLIGVASRNDPALVGEALQRQDLLISSDVIFPIEANWGPKSLAVGRILEAWNVAPDAVVVVDDDPLELDEVRDAFPEVEAVRLPREEDSLWRFLTRLRELFGRGAVTGEDGLRLQSVRTAVAYRELARTSSPRHGDFLAHAGGALEFGRHDTVTERALELINKTNQFNLNGERVSAAQLARSLDQGTIRLVTASYQDRYGPLGIVVALLVSLRAEEVAIETWVMSCRAFARRVEHHCLRYLFDSFGVDRLTLAYRPTDRNAPVREFLAALTDRVDEGSVEVTSAAFEANSPALVHRVSEAGE